MTTPFVCTRIAAAVAGVALALGAGQAFGTGFQLNEQSASSIGNAFAAGAAFTDDVTAMWWNPAALSKFKQVQIGGVINLVTPSIKLQNDGSLPAGCYPPACSPGVFQPLGGTGGDAGGNNWVPNAYVSVPINPQWTFGLGVNVPFGLVTEYDDGWIGRYQGLKSEIKTLNVNPALSWQVTPTFAIGFGANYQRIDFTLTQNINYSGALLQAAAGPPANIPPGSATFNAIAGLTSGLDSKLSITGDDDAWGWNVGLAWDATPQLRLAAAYRSEIKYNISGNADFTNPTVTVPPGTPPVLAGTIAALAAGVNQGGTYNSGITSDDKLPQIANFSFVYQLNPQWELMGDVQWTGWSSIPELRFTRTNGQTLGVVPLNWDDTYKFSGGASYRYNSQWKWRAGIAFDQTPANDTNTTVRLPDSDRWWLALGGEYKATPNWKLDAGFVYIFADSPSFNQNQGSTPANALVKGSYDASVWIISAQAVYSF
jgi:long-chain fatty acid transport protein